MSTQRYNIDLTRPQSVQVYIKYQHWHLPRCLHMILQLLELTITYLVCEHVLHPMPDLHNVQSLLTIWRRLPSSRDSMKYSLRLPQGRLDWVQACKYDTQRCGEQYKCESVNSLASLLDSNIHLSAKKAGQSMSADQNADAEGADRMEAKQ